MEYSYQKMTEGQKNFSNTLQILVLGIILVITGLIEIQFDHLMVKIVGIGNLVGGAILFSSIVLSKILKVANMFYEIRTLLLGFFWMLIQAPAIFLMSRSISIGVTSLFSGFALVVLILAVLAEAFSKKKSLGVIVFGWLRENYQLFILSGLVIFLDQYTKDLVRENIGPYQEIVPFEFLRDIFGLVNIQNSGAAFGMFQDGALFFGLLALVVSCVIIYYYTSMSKEDWLIRLALGIQLGGAVGNLIDRMMFGEVTDFLYFHGFPVFNIADAAVSVGCAIIILGVWVSERRQINDNENDKNELTLEQESIQS